jgi:hypothetical protein
MLDRGVTGGIFHGSAAALVLGVLSALWVGAGVRQASKRQALAN